MGTPHFSVPSLRKIAASDSGLQIKLVVTSPEKPRQSARSKPEPTPVKAVAMAFGLPVYEVEDVKSPEFLQKINEIRPDVIVVVAFRVLPPEVFTAAKIGTFNLHASLLPKYRGAAPINWSIINGDSETGVTTFFIQQKVDTGNIILQKKTEIGEHETATELAVRLSEIGGDAVLETLQMIQNGAVQLQVQDNALATKAPKLFKENTRIDWAAPAKKVNDMIRGLAERPTAWTTMNGKSVKIFQAAPCELSPVQALAAGEWLIQDGKLYVGCGEGVLDVKRLQFEGKKQMEVEVFLRGFRPNGDERFE
ncbi:methionyl-tRNA formyltransferase [Chloroherpeton thalassium ATCC 35110]|uniref:Methionyl-tRNA formyltransferase n=1 Tax=Chloroherpeton thalassium (strain ATCC 35110 / GB-78) TaxID=517418 RepID=B3QS24_CHLT3|nr:methionyl-tRNA formyltransferase [Chloroherpeton thalassium]ACF13969.1 methionyl-tRNA formyltransferase [Chloroherpeton thalassium ATCC 35110]